MFLSALSFLFGICYVQQRAQLPGPSFFALLLLCCAGTWVLRKTPYRRLFHGLIMVFAGVIWASLQAQTYLDLRLPENLAGRNVLVEGYVQGIPVESGGVTRFEFKVQTFRPENTQEVVSAYAPKTIRLSWYYGKSVNAGERWRFLVRLKPPHGFYNPGGFDYEGWLYQRRLHATGYVRKSAENARLEVASSFSLDNIRQQLSQNIQNTLADKPHGGLITALAVGDRAAMTDQQWDVLIRTGTNHLMAISGLHIGLAALFGYWVVRRLVPVRVIKVVPAQHLAIAAGLVLGLVYALLAGLSIPTQRALIMLVSIGGALLVRRHFRPVDALALALLAVLLWDPVSVLAPGFWFSFLAVVAIFYGFAGDAGQRPKWKQWGWIQLVIALALFPLSLFLFQQTSLVAPLANLILVPYVSFLVVPLVLLGLLIGGVSEAVASGLFSAAEFLMSLIWPFLQMLSQWPYASWKHAAPGLFEVFLALGGVLLLLMPRRIMPRLGYEMAARGLGVLLILPIVLGEAETPVQGAFELTMLDVGQGLAVVVRTQNHVLVYDTGAKFSARLDAGESVVVPYLRQASVRHLDKLIISHGDNDHIGGAESVLAAYPAAKLVGQDIDDLVAADKTPCRQGDRWHWDGVDFEILHPDEVSYRRRNNHSCVLRISGQAGAVLLTGDMEKKIERKLMATQPQQIRARVLLVPHHGSKTSSSLAFIQAVQPEIALFPVGYRSRYRHPNKAVVDRYTQAGVKVRYSGVAGAIKIGFHPERGIELFEGYRQTHGKYWQHRAQIH